MEPTLSSRLTCHARDFTAWRRWWQMAICLCLWICLMSNLPCWCVRSKNTVVGDWSILLPAPSPWILSGSGRDKRGFDAMLKRKFDPHKPYKAVVYLRMSDDKQNPRSPDQQDAEIRRCLAILKYPWQILKAYRDDALKGALIRRRPAFQSMLQEIRSGVVQPDLILLDTTERIGRADEIQQIRKQLWEQDGVLILDARSNFCDPTTPQGKAYASFEAMRATQENEVKAHQVVRAKRDLVQRKFWPGGPRPFGFKLVPVTVDVNGVQSVEGSVLERLAQEDWIIARLFQRDSKRATARPGWHVSSMNVATFPRSSNRSTVRPWATGSIRRSTMAISSGRKTVPASLPMYVMWRSTPRKKSLTWQVSVPRLSIVNSG